jgi:hypothetical protein
MAPLKGVSGLQRNRQETRGRLGRSIVMLRLYIKLMHAIRRGATGFIHADCYGPPSPQAVRNSSIC